MGHQKRTRSLYSKTDYIEINVSRGSLFVLSGKGLVSSPIEEEVPIQHKEREEGI